MTNTQTSVEQAPKTRTIIGTAPASAPISLVTVIVNREGPQRGGPLDNALTALERALGWSEGSMSK